MQLHSPGIYCQFDHRRSGCIFADHRSNHRYSRVSLGSFWHRGWISWNRRFDRRLPPLRQRMQLQRPFRLADRRFRDRSGCGNSFGSYLCCHQRGWCDLYRLAALFLCIFAGFRRLPDPRTLRRLTLFKKRLGATASRRFFCEKFSFKIYCFLVLICYNEGKSIKGGKNE